MVLILIFGLDKSDKFCSTKSMELVDFDTKAGLIWNPLIAVSRLFFARDSRISKSDSHFAKMHLWSQGPTSGTYYIVLWSSKLCFARSDMFGPAKRACTYNYLELKMVYALLILWICVSHTICTVCCGHKKKKRKKIYMYIYIRMQVYIIQSAVTGTQGPPWLHLWEYA